MTLIVSCRPQDGSPMVIGDLLVTQEGARPHDIDIPLYADVNRRIPPHWRHAITGLHQKVYIPAPNCVVAFAGSPVSARVVLQGLRTMGASEPLTFERLRTYFNALDPRVANEVAAVGYVGTPPNFVRFGFRYQSVATVGLGELKVAGSGAARFAALAAQDGWIDLRPSRRLTFVDRSLGIFASLAGLMLESEVLSGSTLDDRFGGGYEFAMFVRDRFIKVGDISFLLWRAERVQNDFRVPPTPIAAVKQVYVDGRLFIRAVTHIDRASAQGMASPLLPVPSFESEDAQLLEPPLPTMNSHFTVHVVAAADVEGHAYTYFERRESGQSEHVVFDGTLDSHVTVQHGFARVLAEKFASRNS